MTDFKTINAPFVDFFVKGYGNAPGLNRSEDFDSHGGRTGRLIARWIDGIYKESGLVTEAQQAPAFNHLAYALRRLGYGKEAAFFAQVSSFCDPDNVKLVVANRSLEAYVGAMIDGNYVHGLQHFNTTEEFMRASGVFDETAQIKFLQNKGQIYHRMGMSAPDYYLKAEACFNQALDVLEDAQTLSTGQHNQFKAQIYYCFAKTLAHQVQRDPDTERASDRLTKAYAMITKALDLVEDNADFDFDRACFKSVFGEVIALTGNRPRAREMLHDAREEQIRFGPTLVPRIVATDIKLLALDGIRHVAYEQYNRPMAALLNFHGTNIHPDFSYYSGMLEAAKAGPVFKSVKIGFTIR